MTGDGSGDALFEKLPDITADLTEMFDWARSDLTGDDMFDILDMADENTAVEVVASADTDL